MCHCKRTPLHSLSPSGSDPAVANRTRELFPKNFRDYPGGVEYFDVYSPTISSLYSQGRYSIGTFLLESLIYKWLEMSSLVQ